MIVTSVSLIFQSDDDREMLHRVFKEYIKHTRELGIPEEEVQQEINVFQELENIL